MHFSNDFQSITNQLCLLSRRIADEDIQLRFNRVQGIGMGWERTEYINVLKSSLFITFQYSNFLKNYYIYSYFMLKIINKFSNNLSKFGKVFYGTFEKSWQFNHCNNGLISSISM